MWQEENGSYFDPNDTSAKFEKGKKYICTVLVEPDANEYHIAKDICTASVNNSWSGPNCSTIYDKLLDPVGKEGVISYLAASNDGANNERTRTCPANSESDFAVSVGAVDIEGSRAIFSDYGKTSVDVLGPGVSVLSSVASDIYAPGLYDAEKLNTTTEYYGEFGSDPDKTKPNEERSLSSVWCFDGKKWEQKRDDLKYVGRINDNDGTLSHSDAITPVKNGLIFIGASVDGGVYENPYEPEIILGDADGDRSVTILDVTEIQRYLADLPANENIGKPIA